MSVDLSEKKEKIIYIDYLKVLGLFLVILAHVNCPSVVVQIRSFDVPLLVFLSGYLASRSYNRSYKKKYADYYKKRILRLAVPAWIFLIIYFVVQTVAYTRPTFQDIIMAVTFQRDANMVGMLWVIWVYLVCAFLIPFVSKAGYNKRNVLLIFLFYLLFEIICCFTNIESNRLLYVTVLTVIPWGVVTYLGFYYDRISIVGKKFLILGIAAIFILLTVHLALLQGSFVMTNEYKYPARAYYLCFALPIVLILMELFRSLKLKENRVIKFISESSLWIYLWHILVLYVVKSFIINDDLWLLQYLAIIIISIGITYIQNIIVKKLMSKYNIKFLKVFLG